MSIASYVIDVSGFQPPDRVNWLDPRIGAGIVKATEAATWRSKSTALHMAAMRRAQDVRLNSTDPAVDVLQLGLYHFFHPDVSALAQFQNFCQVADLANYGIGDIIPAIDIESYLTRSATGSHDNPITPAWSEPAEDLCRLLTARYGDCMLYCTKLGWKAMGSPGWLLEHDLWVAQYAMNGHLPFQTCTASPGDKAPKLFQNYVGPMWGAITGKLTNTASPVGVDQNKLYGDFKLIDAVVDVAA